MNSETQNRNLQSEISTFHNKKMKLCLDEDCGDKVDKTWRENKKKKKKSEFELQTVFFACKRDPQKENSTYWWWKPQNRSWKCRKEQPIWWRHHRSPLPFAVSLQVSAPLTEMLLLLLLLLLLRSVPRTHQSQAEAGNAAFFFFSFESLTFREKQTAKQTFCKIKHSFQIPYTMHAQSASVMQKCVLMEVCLKRRERRKSHDRFTKFLICPFPIVPHGWLFLFWKMEWNG